MMIKFKRNISSVCHYLRQFAVRVLDAGFYNKEYQENSYLSVVV